MPRYDVKVFIIIEADTGTDAVARVDQMLFDIEAGSESRFISHDIDGDADLDN